jgi:hypothetical protein
MCITNLKYIDNQLKKQIFLFVLFCHFIFIKIRKKRKKKFKTDLEKFNKKKKIDYSQLTFTFVNN